MTGSGANPEASNKLADDGFRTAALRAASGM